MPRGDSIIAFSGDLGAPRDSAPRHAQQPTPRQVISWLPPDATPGQRDSAIQRHIKPSPIHWSDQPDTLHLPGHGKGKSFRDAALPKYYKESFFSDDSLFHPELPGGRLGVAGDPIPYNIAGDNFITSLLLGCFVLAMFAFAKLRRLINWQVKNFFYAPRQRDAGLVETATEVWFQLFLILQTCLLGAVNYFFYNNSNVGDTFTIGHYEVIGIYTGVIAVYMALKAGAYWFCDRVFFDKVSSRRWMKAFAFIAGAEGVFFFPIVMLQSYFGLDPKNATTCVTVVVILFKLLSIYRSYLIFMYRKGVFLQIILYFCALEIMPLLALFGVLALMNGYLIINI